MKLFSSWWKVTHIIEKDGPSVIKEGQKRELIPVNLCVVDRGAGPAFTELEWYDGEPASYARHEDGTWTFKGERFVGSVKTVEDENRFYLSDEIRLHLEEAFRIANTPLKSVQA